MDIKTIIEDYFDTRANKRRSIDSVHFELHWERDLVRLLHDVNARSLVPFLYTFVASRPRPREIIACMMQGKIVQHHFDRAVSPLAERDLTDRTFNNRAGYGPDRAILTLADDIRRVSHNYTRDCYIIKRDIKAFFPSSDLDRSYARYREVLESRFTGSNEELEELLYLLMRINYSYPQHNAHFRGPQQRWDEIRRSGKSVVFNGTPERGACLGNLYWQMEKNHDLAGYDRWQVEECGMHYVRYVDDMVWVVENKAAGLAHIALSERILRERYGYIMHPDKRYCQHYSKGVEFIGVHIKFGRTYINKRVVRNAEQCIRRWNRMASEKMLGHFLASVNSYIGLMKHKDAYGIIRSLVGKISSEWLKYCHYDDDRRCIVANEGYRHKEILQRRYHYKIKIKRNDRNRKGGTAKHPECRTAQTPSGHAQLRCACQQVCQAGT